MINGIEFIEHLGLFQIEWNAKTLINENRFCFWLLIAEKLRTFGSIGKHGLCLIDSWICHLNNSAVNGSQLATRFSLETKVSSSLPSVKCTYDWGN